MLLDRIDAEGLAPRIDALCTPATLASIRRAHEQLGNAIGVSRGTAMPTPRSIQDACARFAFAVSNYARALSIGLDPSDAAGLERFAAALAPIDALRVKPGESDDDEPTEPVSPTESTRLGEPPPPFTS